MTITFDRLDIQGNILLPYGRSSYPVVRHFIFHVVDLEEAQHFLSWILPLITTAQFFPSKRSVQMQIPADQLRKDSPELLYNIAFTASGLKALGLPDSVLRQFPDAFLDGMWKRAHMLNDNRPDWDNAWKDDEDDKITHMMLSLRASFNSCLKRVCLERKDTFSKSDYQCQETFESARSMMLENLDHESQRLLEQAADHGLAALTGHTSHDPDSKWLECESLVHSRLQDLAISGKSEHQCLAQLHKQIELAHVPPNAKLTDLRYSEYEHFGFFDGSGDPVFEGQYPKSFQDEMAQGQGHLSCGQWRPLAPGEFLLGYPNEAQETTCHPIPYTFSRNGTFMAVRKLEQNVSAFHNALADQAPLMQKWLDNVETSSSSDQSSVGDSFSQALKTLRAKIVGRWDDGTPLVHAPTYESWLRFRKRLLTLAGEARKGGPVAKAAWKKFKIQFTLFTFETDDAKGIRCPFASHIRRSNPRDSGDPSVRNDSDPSETSQASSLLVNRRRILRRGMTYGPPSGLKCEHSSHHDQSTSVDSERGTFFVALCADLARQFEFMQQQWLNYGSDFNLGNDICPIAGALHPSDASETKNTKVMISTNRPDGSPALPFVAKPSSQPVVCRGGAYFFIPSLSAIRLLAENRF
ncbi:hypothetical protein [Synechococcus sp. KORDI-52]|uniref:Dyp-type peroxidase n=1 Tax=Synechococcus sp. KORDI-52 TaxID=585425 RepID=UPI000AE824D0|nr:hypothetical protein [Synechococcus sp. KORDI-52]